MDTAALDEFLTITQASSKVAKQFLNAFGGDVNAAVQAFFEDPDQLVGDANAPQEDDNTENDDEDFIPRAKEFVREPMQQVRKRLVAEEAPQGGRGTRSRRNQPVEAFRDLQAEQGIIFGGRSVNKKATPLADLFRPPLEIMFRGTLEKAAKQAAATTRWLLINIQDSGIFDCQRLNRDTWSDPEIKRIIQASFIMVQLQTTSEQAEEYTNWHSVDNVPHIAILDPETTERLWVQEGFIGAEEAKVALNTFLKDHPFDMDNSAPKHHHSSTSSAGSNNKRQKSFDEMTEEEQMAMVIEQSLKEQMCDASGSSQTTPAPSAPSHRATKLKSRNRDDSSDSDFVPEIEERSRSPPKRRGSNLDEDSDSESQSTLITTRPKRAKLSENTETAESSLAPAEASKEEDIDWTDNTPIPDSPPDCTLQIRLPDGTNVVQKFHGIQKLSSVAKFVKEHLKGRSSFYLATTFPRRKFEREELPVLTLKDASLVPRAVVVVEDS